MKTVKYFNYDINQGGRREFHKSIIFLIMTLLVILEMDKFVQTLIEYGYCETNGTFLDFAVYFFRGDYVYELSPTTSFILPVYWLAFHAFIAYVVGFYPYEDFIQYGKLSVLYGKDRLGWWIAKILWQIVMVIWCYLIVYGTLAGYTIITHRALTLDLTEDIWNNLSPEILNHTAIDIVVVIVVMPILTSITITVIQGVIAFWLTPVVAFLSVNAMLVVSVYSTSHLWIGNYTMWLRSDWVSQKGIRAEFAIVIDCILIIIFLKIGIRRFKESDIIEKGTIL